MAHSTWEGGPKSESDRLGWLGVEAVSELPHGEAKGVSDALGGVAIGLRPGSSHSWVACSTGGSVDGKKDPAGPAGPTGAELASNSVPSSMDGFRCIPGSMAVS